MGILPWFLFVAIAMAPLCEAYRILAIFPFNGKSHFVMADRLLKVLAERGHQVDVVGHFPLKKPIPNYNDVVSLAGTLPDVANNMTYDFMRSLEGTGSSAYLIPHVLGGSLCELMGQPAFRKLIDNPPKDPPYDVLITEVFGANCYLGMGKHLNIPVVGIVTSVMFPWANDMFANPEDTSYIPNVFSGFNGRMNFWQRFTNTLGNLKAKWDFTQGSADQDDIMKKYFGPNAPSLKEVQNNVSLILVNSHYSLNGVRPFTTAVVEVGGLHIDDKIPPMSKDLEKWLDDSKDGFVYISFGSMMKIESFPRKTLDVLYASMARLAPVRVLMKIAAPEELPPGLPSNVFTYPWIPQLSVLNHKNIRAFMTHGGLMGTQEAIYFGVPMIGVPLFGDQIQNIRLYAQLNIAVELNLNDLTEKNLDAAFNAVLHDPSYTEKAKKISAEFRDRPMKSVDTAVFWIEYVVRHGGLNIRSLAMDLSWWQLKLLDVYGLLLLFTILALYFVKVLVCKLKAVFFALDTKNPGHDKKVK